MAGSRGERLRKIESASRCRVGEEGAVNWNTAGPVRATLWDGSLALVYTSARAMNEAGSKETCT